MEPPKQNDKTVIIGKIRRDFCNVNADVIEQNEPSEH